MALDTCPNCGSIIDTTGYCWQCSRNVTCPDCEAFEISKVEKAAAIVLKLHTEIQRLKQERDTYKKEAVLARRETSEIIFTANDDKEQLQEIVDKAHDLVQLVVTSKCLIAPHRTKIKAQVLLERIGELKRCVNKKK